LSFGVPTGVIVKCSNCGAAVDIWREPVVQADREADRVGPAVHVIRGGGWVLHTCALRNDHIDRGT
jgi:hypothetical protein